MTLLRFFRPTAANRWQKTLYIMFFAQLLTAVGFSSMFPFLPLYIGELGTRTSLSLELLAGLVYSAHAFTMMISSPIWGGIADRYGRKLMVERAMFGGALILPLMAFVGSAEELVLLRALQGAITGTVAAANALVASAVPRRHTGYAMGLLQVGLGAGVALGPLIGGAIADVFGYHAAFYVTGGLLFIAGIMVWRGVEEDFTKDESLSTKGASFLSEWRQVLSAPGVNTTYSLRFLSQLGRMMLIPIVPLFIPILMPNINLLNTFTGLVVGVTSATTTLSAIYLGRLGDRIGYRRIVVISAFGAALLYYLQSLVTTGWHLLVLQALVGVSMGGIIPAISALLARLTRAGEEGAVYGLDNSINAAGRWVAPLLSTGVAVQFNLRATFVATAVLFLITGLLAAWRLPQVSRTKQQTEKPAP